MRANDSQRNQHKKKNSWYLSLNTFWKISNILCKQISVFVEHFQDVSWLHKKCTSLVQNIQHLNVKQIVHGLLISGKTPFFRPVFCKICSFFYKKENINNINKIKSFLLEQIYSILVSGFLSYNQFKVSQFLEIEQKRNCNVFRVGGGLGLYRGGMCRASARTLGHETSTFGDSKLLNGATTSAKSKPKACTSVLEHFEASVFPGPPWPGL